ncbi:MAG: hypothetical protein BWY72_02280 [Bacteroidetes bacterium ADurb.Bin416]|nr:MAG: hypothetical protein BWY72_02280 [Bacteroidetes bacterium ADurb.Bin416]
MEVVPLYPEALQRLSMTPRNVSSVLAPPTIQVIFAEVVFLLVPDKNVPASPDSPPRRMVAVVAQLITCTLPLA